MSIGVIGIGDIGAVIVNKLRDAGYPGKMANSKGPDSLRELAAKTGAIPVSVEEVVQDVDILFLVLPQKAFPVLPKGLLNKAKKETIVIDAGTIAESWRQQPGSPVYCVNPTKEELQQGLKNVDRSSLITNKEKGTKAYRAVENADYQTQANAFRSLLNEEMKR